MKQVIKNFSFMLLALAVAAPVSLMAQNTDKEKDKSKDKKETEQIIITHNGDQKIVVEVNAGKVTVNGKPVEDYKGNDVVVLHNKIKDMAALNGQLLNSYNLRSRAFTLDANRAMLGVVTEKAEQGAEINEITKESGAEKAGLKKGDVITKIDETKIESPDDLSKVIREHKPGDKVGVTFLRDKKEQKVTAELTQYKGVTAFSFGNGQQNFGMTMPDVDFERIVPRVQAVPRGSYNYNFNWSGGNPKMGLSIQDTEDGKGVKVIDVDDESNAEKAGIKEDDIITEVDGKSVNSTDEITKIIRESKDKVSVKMKLTRNGKTENVEVKIPRRLKTTDL